MQYTLDLAGLLTMGIFLVSLLVALSQGQREGWDAPLIQRLFVVAGVAFVTFIACELLTEHPLIDLRLLYQHATFSAVSVPILMFFMIFTASTFMQVILMQRLLDYTPLQTGLVLIPGSLALSLGFPLAEPRGRPLRPPGHYALCPQRFRPGVVSLHLSQPGVADELDRLAGAGSALQLRQFCSMRRLTATALSQLPRRKCAWVRG